MSLAECRRCGERAVFRALCALCLYQAGGETGLKYEDTAAAANGLRALIPELTEDVEGA